jgi:hypothetical protein
MSTHLSQDEAVPARAYVATRRLKVGNDYRDPGQLVMEAGDWLPKVLGIYLDQGYLEEIRLLTDSDRQTIRDQLAREEADRAERERQRAEAEANAPKPAPPPPLPEGAVTLNCANCKRPRVFPQKPHLRAVWECGGCGQRETREQAEAGTLQMIAPHAYNHNRVSPNWSPDYK